MAIDTSKLICPAIFQNFVDAKTGIPLAAGVVTFSEDSNRQILKDVYYQTGIPGNYQYASAPNPMILSAAGSTVDVNGNDVLLFYYPWLEANSNISDPYFITVYDSLGTLQFTRANFPFVPQAGSSPIVNTQPTYENYIINNRFWRNLGSLSLGPLPSPAWTTQYNTSGNYYYQTLAPDQHDGFSMPDFNYIKNIQGSSMTVNEVITFNTFAQQTQPVLINDIQPEFYINYNCISDSSGATLKVFQFPISLHLATLSCQPFTFTIQGQLNSGFATIGVYLYTFCGTGVASPPPALLGNITFNTTWTKFYITNVTFTPTSGLILGSSGTGGNDDAYYLQLAMPTTTNAVCNLNFTLPSIYLSSTQTQVPTNSFSTYDQIDAVVASPRTGDVKVSINTFNPYGWVPLNDGTIAIPDTGAVTVDPPTNLAISYQGYDAWPLYNLLWNTFQAYSSGGSLLMPIYNSAGSLTTYGASAYADWNAFKQIQLTQTMGQVLLGTAPVSTLPGLYTQTVTTSNGTPNLVFTGSANFDFFNGMPIYFTNIVGTLSNISTNTIYYVGGFNGTTGFVVSTTFANAISGTYIAFVGGTSATATVVGALAGTYEGEYAHAQRTVELAAHFHTYQFPTSNRVVSASGSSVFANSSAVNTTNAQDSSGNFAANVPMNVTQQGIFFNMFMKL